MSQQNAAANNKNMLQSREQKYDAIMDDSSDISFVSNSNVNENSIHNLSSQQRGSFSSQQRLSQQCIDAGQKKPADSGFDLDVNKTQSQNSAIPTSQNVLAEQGNNSSTTNPPNRNSGASNPNAAN